MWFCFKKFPKIPEMDKINIEEVSVSESLLKDLEVDFSSKTEDIYMINKFNPQGLVADMLPTIKLMKIFGFFLFNYYDEADGGSVLAKKAYAYTHAIVLVIQYVLMIVNMVKFAEEVNELTANTITVMFFIHSFVKYFYFAIMCKTFYRTWAIWNSPNSHPLFAESDARYHASAVAKIRASLNFVLISTAISIVSWVTITFFGESTALIIEPATNDTITVEVPRLPFKSYYPFDVFSGIPRILIFIFQVYWMIFTMMQGNLMDQVFCSWLIFACEQLQHLKGIMKPLMELSATLDTYRPDTAELFKISGAETEKNDDDAIKNSDALDMDFRGVYSSRQDFGMNYRGGSQLQTFGGNNSNPNGLTKKQEMLVRSAIKYWVERHKHIVRLVSSVGDAYGVALLFHMLFATISLTLLAYQATKINGMNVYAMTVLGYLIYTLGQVFHFCVYGNQLIEESSSVMEAAYSCHWYNGSEEAKTFVQIVCQQCQKAMSISGAKFFTVSLDLFASVLGAMVTYFMVLVQLS